MVQAGGRLSFSLESVQATRIGRKNRRQDLDRDVAMKPKIARAIGTSHPARPEEGDDFVVSEPCAFREGQAHRSWRLEEPGPNIDK